MDSELLAAASAAVEAVYRPGWHFVGAAVRGASGAVYTGVNLQAYVSRIAVCAEPIALGQSVMAADGPIMRAVAVYKPDAQLPPVVCSPCGMCREMLHDYGGEAVEVVVPGDAGPEVMTGRDLLPVKYVRDSR
ncbi:cytidine deaminase [Egicoccus sp. AB-alg2]|uniref:cytidine deaminase n=1 Tax=Egicoccus sp. AB-alg2 TaxID=3242693 RepID=UPI00359D4E78